MTTVGVVIPVHDHAPFVAAAIRSVLGQTRPPDRLVIVDDGSHDDSLTVVERTVAAHPGRGIDIEVRGQENRGAAATLNRELTALGTDVITVLNSDDEWHPERLERLVPLLEPGRAGLVFSDTEFFGMDAAADVDDYRRHHGRILRLGRRMPSLSTALRLWNLAISTGNLVMTRTLWDAVGPFDTALPIAHDWEFLLRAAREVEPVLQPQRLFRYRIHAGNTSRTDREAAAADLLAVLQVQLAQCVAAARNPLAATARTLPTFLPFLVPLWESTLGPGTHAIPRLIGRRAAEVRAAAGPDGPVLTGPQQARLAAELLGALGPEDPAGPVAGEDARAAADAWAALAAGVPARRPPSGSPPVAAATFSWGGRDVTVHAEDPEVVPQLAELLGVRAIGAGVALGRADLTVVGAGDVVTRGQLRTFPGREDRLVWLALTLSEFLMEGTAVVLHAAAIATRDGVLAVCGPPHAGKSTFAGNAVARGLDVLGDDQLELRPMDGGIRAAAVPRPLKLRARGAAPAPDPRPRGVRGRLDGERVTLLPRPTGHDGDGLALAAVVHLHRRTGPGVTIEPIVRAGRAALMLPQLRGSTIPAGLVDELERIPTVRVAVGPDADIEALDRILEAIRSGAP